MKRLLSLAVTGVMCGAVVLGTSGIAGAASHTAGTQVQPGGPMVGVPGAASLTTVSDNWAGYAATSSKKFTYVHSTFVEPTLHCGGHPDQWVSHWVGFDGLGGKTAEQVGTDATCGGAKYTTPVYEAWYEMYPSGVVNVFKVSATDPINASVSYTDNQFVLTITDLNSQDTKTVHATCASCQRSTAEWITERPTACASGKCTIAALANFRRVTLNADNATVTGGTMKSASGLDPTQIDMIQPIKLGFISLATAGELTGTTFSVNWERPGVPTTPTSGPRR